MTATGSSAGSAASASADDRGCVSRHAVYDRSPREVDIFNTDATRPADMALERERRCPECATVRPFYRTASTRLALGEKTKWRCPECGHGVVRIGDDIETTA